MFSSFRPEALQGARDGARAAARLLVDTLWPGWLDVARARWAAWPWSATTS
jgi:hypothetical protein